jgi:N-dimethylarginine dimethylaminohydrolase
MTIVSAPRFLMCHPRHFEVIYSLNPWMEPREWSMRADALATTAEVEWRALKLLIERLGGIVDLVTPAPGVPDLVFTANSAVVLDGIALVARFRNTERQLEEPHITAAFDALVSRQILKSRVLLPADIVLEGAGDCIWDPHRKLFWVGYGPRSSKQATTIVEETFAFRAVSLELVDPRFYHLDTGFSVLADGEIMYFKNALSPGALGELHDRVDSRDRIEVDEEDACRMSLNGIGMGRTLILSDCSPNLRRKLADRGYSVEVTPLSAFQLSGGSAYCLTLRTDLTSTDRSRASNVDRSLSVAGETDRLCGQLIQHAN